MSRSRILFLYENEAPFVWQDLAILRERFEITAKNCAEGVGYRSLFRMLRSVDASFSWFAAGYAARAVLLGKILRRPSVVVAGGFDVINMPEIGYGAAMNPRRRRRARFTVRKANVLLTMSQWSRDTIRELSGREADLLYLGVDVNTFRPRPAKEDVVVTVGVVTKENLKRKGLEAFVRAAAKAPDLRFLLIGRHDEEALRIIKSLATPNLEILGWLPDEQLREILGRAKVYVQVSYNEGFGLALAEAMASGCVPVVTSMGSLPEVAGEVGFYVPFDDPLATAGAVREALASGRGSRARERVAKLFPISVRRERLLKVVEGVLR